MNQDNALIYLSEFRQARRDEQDAIKRANQFATAYALAVCPYTVNDVIKCDGAIYNVEEVMTFGMATDTPSWQIRVQRLNKKGQFDLRYKNDYFGKHQKIVKVSTCWSGQ